MICKDDIKIGMRVTYYSVITAKGVKLFPRVTKIRSEPWALGHGEIVCKVDDVNGGVSIRHLDPIEDEHKS